MISPFAYKYLLQCAFYSAFLFFISLEGLPPTIENSGKSLHRTHPAAIMLPFFICTTRCHQYIMMVSNGRNNNIVLGIYTS